MKETKQWILLSVIVIILGALIFGVTATTANTEPEQVVLDPFYGVAPELEAELKQIAVSDSRVKDLISEKEYNLTVDGHTIIDTDYSLSVGVYLQDDITPDQFVAWVKDGRHDSIIIKEYTGVLYIGYNCMYRFWLDKTNGTIKEFSRVVNKRPLIPEVTAQEKNRALEIALADATVRQLLEGKKYQIAPSGKIGVWHEGETILGVSFQIDFDKSYFVSTLLPKYQAESAWMTGEIDGVIIDILLNEGRVANIIPKSPASEDYKEY
jgi:hypothetical protein